MRPTTPALTPEWLSAHIDTLLDRGPGFVGMTGVTYVELDSSDEPMSLIAADTAGLVLAEWNSSDDVDVRFVPWRNVRSIGVNGTDLDIYLIGESQTTSFDLHQSDDQAGDAEKARGLALEITMLMRRAARRP